MKSIEKNARVITWMLTLCYFASYMTRINFAVMIVKICSDMALPKTELAIVLTGMTVFYGTGQIVNGILCSRLYDSLQLFQYLSQNSSRLWIYEPST